MHGPMNVKKNVISVFWDPIELLPISGDLYTVHFSLNLQGGTRNVIPLIVHVTHFYYYKNIWHLVQN